MSFSDTVQSDTDVDTLAYTQACVIRAPTTTATVTQLTANSSYAFHVLCTNSAGTSTRSTILTTRTSPGTPLPPTNVSVEALSTSSLRIRWQPADDQGAQLTAYAVHCVNDRSKCDEMLLSTEPTTSELKLEQLKPETSYR
jgi:hypothetical protein